MSTRNTVNWESRIVTPEKALSRIEPGMRIFLGTGVAEPRTLVKYLMASHVSNLTDLELIQLVSFGEAVSLEEIRTQKYRLRTFFSGWVASEAITEGRVDLIPSRFSRIPALLEWGQILVDAAFVQITPPDPAGYCSLGVAIDVARQAMEQASIVVGEINDQVPYTYGDTFVPVTDFDLLVRADEPPIYFDRWPVDDIFDRVAEQVATIVEDGSCLAFSIGPLYDALSRQLTQKRNLGIHSPFVTDAVMDLVKSGAVTNRRKNIFRGKTVCSYALGTKELMDWLDRNPLVEFQGIDKVFSPPQIGRNPRVVAVKPARKVDLSGRIALHAGRGNVAAGPGEMMDFVNGAELSKGGKSVFALPSRSRSGQPNIRVSVESFPNLFTVKESVDMVVTEYGVAHLTGRPVRERAQALIDIAHPDDRKDLVEEAKAARILYSDQIFLPESVHFYPSEIQAVHKFKGKTTIRFRAIKPSDEEEMRRLFYRFSDEAVYYRYFSPIKAMPHSRMQEYVNIDYRQTMSIVGLADDRGRGHIVAEGRFIREAQRPWAEVAFVVDEAYQGLGIATFLFNFLIRTAKKLGIQGFTADVLSSNMAMMKVFGKGNIPVNAKLVQGVYELAMPFEGAPEKPAGTDNG